MNVNIGNCYITNCKTVEYKYSDHFDRIIIVRNYG